MDSSDQPYGAPGGEARDLKRILMYRSPILVFVLSVLTLGLYLIFWYHRVYVEWAELTGRTPTGNGFLIDLLLHIVTCGVWGIYVDYRISEEISAYRKSQGLPENDTTLAVIILDVAAYFTIAVTYFVSSAMQQDLLNDLREDVGRPGA